MFFETDLVSNAIITVVNYNGKAQPEIVNEAPKSKSYTELTDVVIPASRVISMENNRYKISYQMKKIIIHDVNNLIKFNSNAEFFHIIFMINHEYDEQSKLFLHSESFVIHAKALTKTKDTPSEYSGLFYVPNESSELIFDDEFNDYDKKYFENHTEINLEYAIFFKSNIFKFESIEIHPYAIETYFNNKYSATLTDDKIYRFLKLNGMENVLKDNLIKLTVIKGYYDYDNHDWFNAVDYLYDDVDVVPLFQKTIV